MDGFRYFRGTTSYQIPPSPLPEAQCVYGSSSQTPVGETHLDQTLEASFSRLKLSPFGHRPLLSSFDGDCSNGSLNGCAFRNNDVFPSNGVLSHLGLEDCWLESSDIDSSNGVSNLNRQHYSTLKSLSAADFRGKVASFAKDQNGCRFLQKAMEEEEGGDQLVIELILLEVLEDVASLMLHPHGNYVVQKLIEACSEEQRTRMLSVLTNKNDLQLICLALDTRGTRCVQKLLKYVTTKEQISMIVRALSPGVVALSKNVNGQHVLEHCLAHFSDEDNECLLLVVVHNCFGIAKDKSGCCLLQKCVEHSNGEIREHLVAAIIAKARVLAVDRYGNYVVQYLLGLRIPQITKVLLRQLQGHYFFLSFSKYGSNVVEKCLLESGEEQSSQIIFELLTSQNVSMLLWHPYGNYVIQTALAVSKGIHHNALLKLVSSNSHIMRRDQYGAKVLAWIERNLRRQ